MDDGGRFARCMSSIEHLVVKLVIFATLLMIAIQIGMTNDKVRRVLSYTERIEGIPLAGAFRGEKVVSTPGMDDDPRSIASPIRSTGTVSLELEGVESLGQARVLVNGYPVADFDYSIVTVQVRPGDLIELSCRPLAIPVEIKVQSISPGISFPIEGSTFTLRDRVSVGRVQSAQLVSKP